MWELRVQGLAHRGAHRMVWSRNNVPLSYGEVAGLWRSDPAFREQFIRALRDAPFQAYFWETPPLTEQTLGESFECVLVDSAELAGVRVDGRPFRDQLGDDPDGSGVAAFWNLGGDALLVAPRMQGPTSAYGHLATFSREAPQSQQQAFWAAVGAALETLVGTRPVWVSTSGLGVYWLHVRLDRRPKYYTYAPYRDENFWRG